MHTSPIRTLRSARTLLLAAVAVALMAATFVQSSGVSGAAIVAADITVGSDGSGFGTGSQCGLEDSPGVRVDASSSDRVVCTNDTVMYLWTFSIDAGGAQDATFTQTLPPGWHWDTGTTAWCAGAGGVGTITPDGLTLTCVVDVAAGVSVGVTQLQMVAHVDATAANLSTYTAALDLTQSAGPTVNASADTVTVRSAPRYELHKRATGGQSVGSHDFGDGNGAVPAAFVDFRIFIDVAGGSNAKGVEAIATPVTFSDVVTGIAADPTAPRAVVSSCGQMSGSTTTCDQPGGPGTDVIYTIDTPTHLLGTSSTSVDNSVSPSAVYSSVSRVALPLAEVPGAPVGLDVVNQLTDFHPLGVNGSANFNGTPEQGSEPGADCATPSANNNCAQAHLTGAGGGGSGVSGTKQLRRGESNAGIACPTGGTHDVSACPKLVGDTDGENGSVTPGTPIWARAHASQGGLWEGGYPTLHGLITCDTWDPALQTIDPARQVRVGHPAALAPGDYLVEYTDRVLTSDTERRNASCGLPGDTSTAGDWYPSIAAAGGPEAVSGVRVTHLGGGWDRQHFMIMVPMIAGSTAGAVPDFFGARWDENVTGANPTGHRFLARDGYRVTPSQLGIDKDTVPANTLNRAAGAAVEYSLQPTVTVSNNPGPDPVTGLTVVDTMHRCTTPPALSPSTTDWTMVVTTPADPGPDGLACTGDPGETGATLAFTHIGAVTPNTAIQAIRYTTSISPFATNAMAVTNTAVVSLPGNTQDGASRTDTWTITISAPSALRISKVADVPLVEIEPDQISWTIAWSNTMATSAGRTTWVDVLPHVGDGRGSDFDGTFRLASATLLGASSDVTVDFTAEDPDDVDTSPDLVANTTTWCPASDFGTVGCPTDMAEVTAVRFSNADFVAGEIGGLRLVAAPRSNTGGDVYVNNIASGRAEGINQNVPATPNSQIAVVASSIGDVVWWDLDGDGVQGAGEPGVEGVAVRLLDVHGTVLAASVTDASGGYRFENLHSGDYRTVLDMSTVPAGTSNTYDLDGGTAGADGDSGLFAIGVDTHRPAVDYGIAAVGVDVDKRVIGEPERGADGTDTVRYRITVSNVGQLPTTYTLSDQLRYGSGIQVVGQQVRNDSGVVTDPGWDGAAATTVAADVAIAGSATHTYVVEVRAIVGPEVAASRRSCVAPDGTGTGFLNTAWTVSNTVDTTSAACVEAAVAAAIEERPTPQAPPPAAPQPTAPTVGGADAAAPRALAFTGSPVAALLSLAALLAVLGAAAWLAATRDRRRRSSLAGR